MNEDGGKCCGVRREYLADDVHDDLWRCPNCGGVTHQRDVAGLDAMKLATPENLDRASGVGGKPDEFLERLAEAICDTHAGGGVYRVTTEEAREHWRPVARAAFETCRLSENEKAVYRAAQVFASHRREPEDIHLALGKRTLRAAEDAVLK